ncbi:MAG: hypothetical protein WCA44_00205 [Acidobacteriaceae bacterium]|jgi:hypothetical protein
MAAHPVDSSFRFPDLIAAPAHPDGISGASAKRRPADSGLGALRGLAFALVFEAALAVVGFSGFELWRLLR